MSMVCLQLVALPPSGKKKIMQVTGNESNNNLTPNNLMIKFNTVHFQILDQF